MTERKNRPRPPPANIRRPLDQHRRWLETAGREGVRLGVINEDEVEDQIIDLSGLDLSGTDLSVARLNCHDFSHGSLRHASLLGTELDGANFDGCDVAYAQFDRADLSLAHFAGAKGVTRASFRRATIKETIWTEDDAKRFRDNSLPRINGFMEQFGGWTDAEWEAFHRHSNERWDAAEKLYPELIKRRLAYWSREKLSGRQP